MLRGDWVKLAAVGLALAIPIGVGSAFLVDWANSRSAEYERIARDQTDKYNGDAGRENEQACGQLVAIEQPNCRAEARAKQRENERDEQDLVAQRQSALWAYVMALAAVIGMALSAIGVMLVWITFRETKQANAIAQDHQRARIVPFARWEPQTLNTSHVVLGCENVGLSPALNLRCSIQAADSAPAHPPQFGEWGERRLVPAGGDGDLTVCQSGILAKILVGCIRYDTIYEAGRETPFCIRFERGTVTGGWYAVDCTPDSWPKPT